MVRLEKFEQLEKGVSELVDRFALLKKEKDEAARALKKESSENQLAQERLERLYRDRYQLRSKLDALIEKIESVEQTK
jgi:FtsZ-binding cell division protein ZapB